MGAARHDDPEEPLFKRHTSKGEDEVEGQGVDTTATATHDSIIEAGGI